MFRLGSLLFIPAYITVTLYRTFASAEDDGNFMLMTGEFGVGLAKKFRTTDVPFSLGRQHVRLNADRRRGLS